MSIMSVIISSVRWPASLYKLIKKAAAARRLSINAYLVEVVNEVLVKEREGK